MRRKTRKHDNRKGIAAVEAAVCLPVLIVIWLGTVEVSRTLTLKQQGQLMASTAASRILESGTPFAEIEADLETLAEDLGIFGVDVSVKRFDPELVESTVTIDIDQNSSLGSLYPNREVVSRYYAFREE